MVLCYVSFSAFTVFIRLAAVSVCISISMCLASTHVHICVSVFFWQIAIVFLYFQFVNFCKHILHQTREIERDRERKKERKGDIDIEG